MGLIKVSRMVLGPASTNCFVIYREGGTDAVVVDPANLGEKIYNAMKGSGLSCAGMLLTHGHYDHLRGAKRLQQLSGAKIYAHEAEKEICESAHMNVSTMFGEEYTLSPDELLRDNQEFDLAGIHFKVIHTPGHTAGGCCYYVEEKGMLFCGDTIFQQSIARSDLPTGQESVLQRSIRNRILTLPDETILFCGHGDKTTVGEEKMYNPFVQ